MELFIEQIIIEHHGYKDTNCLLANNILTAIEKAGMLPPRVKGAYELWGFNPYVQNNYWEPEND